jgi:hypothetical protein
MAKTRKNINAFTEALKSNTKSFSSEGKKSNVPNEEEQLKELKIDQDILNELIHISEDQNISFEDLHNFALRFFLKFKDDLI